MTIISPPTYNLNLDFRQGFCLGWTAMFEQRIGNYILFHTDLVLNKQHLSFNISLSIDTNPHKNMLHVAIGSTKKSWIIHTVNSPSAYLLVFNSKTSGKNQISFFKESEVESVPHSKLPAAESSSQGDILDSNMKFTNSPFIINPRQNNHLRGSIYQLYGYSNYFDEKKALNINHFMFTRCCKHHHHEEEHEPEHEDDHHYPVEHEEPATYPPSTPQPTTSESPIPFDTEEGEHAHYSQSQSKDGCGGTQNQNVKVIISGDLTSDKDIPKTRKTIQSLVKAFNAREKDPDDSDPNEKIEYHVRPDGKVVRRVYRKKPKMDGENNNCYF